MREANVQIAIPDVAQYLGDLYQHDWDYQWALPSTVAKLKRFGFVALSEPINFYYGATIQLIGRRQKNENCG